MYFYLQNIVNDISLEDLPAKWQAGDLSRFSQDKALFDFQRQGLQNALKGLWLYFNEKNADKRQLFAHYRANNFTEDFDYNLTKKDSKKTAKYLLEYDTDYPVTDGKIRFMHFINRMNFWMATGSGKTLIIIKLIEMVGKLIAKQELPAQDILFLAHRDDLLEQFKKHIEEFNSFNFDVKINLKNLKDYESVKWENPIPFTKNEITVFYYRSDLISDEHKEKIVNFRNYDNDGRWYIFLDEAHKGDREDSKRQVLYSILSRNGFMFNFSATFTDPRDYATCVFNFNLSKFVEGGYSKHIYVSPAEVNAFRGQDDFSPVKKQKIVLKTLLLLTYINKCFEKVRKADHSLYHHPLLMTLVNSVNVEKSDLELFFKELEKIAEGKIREEILDKAKEELVEEFKNHPTFEFEELSYTVDTSLISKLGCKDILKYILHAKTPGKIEVLKIPGNKQELIFKLKTTAKPFALIKIGDISGWMKDKLKGYEINESFENESYFRQINEDDSDINILMGSRSFYEGWDSNRPNLLLFVNIGVGKDTKKFVLQSIGRGVRIEPKKNQRKRLLNLLNANKIEADLFNKVQKLIVPIESLFVFGTNAENLREIIKTLKDEKQDISLGEIFELNPEVEKHPLLVPVYKTAKKIFAEENSPQKYPISQEDFDSTRQLYEFLGDKVTLATYDCEVNVLKKTQESFSAKEQYYHLDGTTSIREPELTLGRIFDYLRVKNKELGEFKELENEIVHFRNIKFRDGDKYKEIRQKIELMLHYPEKRKVLDEQYGRISIKEYEKQLILLEQAGKFELNGQKINIKYLANHYYLPVIVSETEKIDYLNHIINIDSEVKFIKQLEDYLGSPGNVFTQFDWWMFSKLDHTLDEIMIPYYNPRTNNIANFKPDFIFWAQKNNRYLILFVDPKGTEHTDGYRKIDGYSKIFETDKTKQSRNFAYNGFTINTKLLLKPKRGIADVPDAYKRYWFDNFDDFANKIS